MTHPNLHILEHPLIQQKLYYLRSKKSNNLSFRNMLDEIAALMVYEVTRDLPLLEREVETPLEITTGYVLSKKLTLVPILRAGLAMCDGILKLIPQARVGHLGLYRDKDSLKPVEYYSKFPSDMNESEVIIIDPMLATGGSAAYWCHQYSICLSCCFTRRCQTNGRASWKCSYLYSSSG